MATIDLAICHPKQDSFAANLQKISKNLVEAGELEIELDEKAAQLLSQFLLAKIEKIETLSPTETESLVNTSIKVFVENNLKINSLVGLSAFIDTLETGAKSD